MPGPKAAEEARIWIQEAMRDGRYVPVPHFVERMAQRGIDMLDVHSAIQYATAIEPYEDVARNRGTCWRLWGLDVDRVRTIGVGVEAFLEKRRRRIVLCTTFVKEEA